MSDEDDDAALLTSKVEEKLLSTLAKIKMKDPSIYEKTNNNLFEGNPDFIQKAILRSRSRWKRRHLLSRIANTPIKT